MLFFMVGCQSGIGRDLGAYTGIMASSASSLFVIACEYRLGLYFLSFIVCANAISSICHLTYSNLILLSHPLSPTTNQPLILRPSRISFPLQTPLANPNILPDILHQRLLTHIIVFRTYMS